MASEMRDMSQDNERVGIPSGVSAENPRLYGAPAIALVCSAIGSSLPIHAETDTYQPIPKRGLVRGDNPITHSAPVPAGVTPLPIRFIESRC